MKERDPSEPIVSADERDPIDAAPVDADAGADAPSAADDETPAVEALEALESDEVEEANLTEAKERLKRVHPELAELTERLGDKIRDDD